MTLSRGCFFSGFPGFAVAPLDEPFAGARFVPASKMISATVKPAMTDARESDRISHGRNQSAFAVLEKNQDGKMGWIESKDRRSNGFDAIGAAMGSGTRKAVSQTPLPQGLLEASVEPGISASDLAKRFHRASR